MNVLAIVAHMDDGEEHCGGTLRKYVLKGDKAFILVVTNGNKGSYTMNSEAITNLRKEEQREASRRLGMEEPFFLDYEDDLMIDCLELRLDLIHSIRHINPAVILTHSPNDGSNDHAAVSRAVTAALIALPFPNIPKRTIRPSIDMPEVPENAPPMSAMPQVFFFESDGGIGSLPEVYVDITDVIEDKLHAFKAHKSQTDYDPRYLEGTELLSRFRGFQSGVMYAEAFNAHRFFGFMPDYKILP